MELKNELKENIPDEERFNDSNEKIKYYLNRAKEEGKNTDEDEGVLERR